MNTVDNTIDAQGFCFSSLGSFDGQAVQGKYPR